MSRVSLSTYQRKLVAQLIAVTESPPKQAVMCMQDAGWDVSRAVDLYYAYPEKYTGLDMGKVEKAFLSISSDGNAVEVDGILKMCEMLSIDPNSTEMMLFAWKSGAAAVGRFDKKEFTSAMVKLGVDSLKNLGDALSSLSSSIFSDIDSFRDFYSFVFNFIKEDPEHRTVGVAEAIDMWRLLFNGKFGLLDEWLAFVQEHQSRPISKDQWAMLLDFAVQINDDISKYDEDGAWPTLMDEFVEHMQEKMK